MPTQKYFMQLAVQEARKNLKSLHGGPFGACVVKDGKILAISRNTVLRKQDPTCHAEINAIRIAARKLKSFDLSKCVIYSTTEPCPMCFSAIHWARVSTVIYGTTTKDAKAAGFNELMIEDVKLKKLGGSKVKLKRSALLKECRGLFELWVKLPHKKSY